MNDRPTKQTLYGNSIEDDVVGTWFARLGVLALLIGAAFGYRYAVDQGLIGAEARVALGVMSGAALIGFGHWARNRGWTNFAHALSGGGIAVLFLSVLAAQFRFELISPAVALILLSGVALLSAWLAIGYDSLPLAVLATLGAFMNPYFLAADDATAALTYVVGVDVALVALAFYKRWASLNKLALAGTVYIVATTAFEFGGPSAFESLGFITVLWVLFTMVPFIQALRENQQVGAIDAGLIVAVGALYLAGGRMSLWLHDEIDHGIFVMVAGLAYAGFAGLAYSDRRTRVPLATIFGAMGVGFITMAAPLMMDGPAVHLVWAVEGAVLLYVAGVLDDVLARVTAGALIVAGVIGTVEAMSVYEPSVLLLDPTSIAIAAEILVLYGAAWLVGRDGDEEWQRPLSQAILVTANLLTLGWLSQEVVFEVARSVESAGIYEATQFALSGLWATYSAALIAAGVAMRQAWARYLGLATFTITVVKMISVDLWQLEVLQRTFAFVGLGVLMIACSFLYNRFRDLIVGTEA